MDLGKITLKVVGYSVTNGTKEDILGGPKLLSNENLNKKYFNVFNPLKAKDIYIRPKTVFQ